MAAAHARVSVLEPYVVCSSCQAWYEQELLVELRSTRVLFGDFKYSYQCPRCFDAGCRIGSFARQPRTFFDVCFVTLFNLHLRAWRAGSCPAPRPAASAPAVKIEPTDGGSGAPVASAIETRASDAVALERTDPGAVVAFGFDEIELFVLENMFFLMTGLQAEVGDWRMSLLSTLRRFPASFTYEIGARAWRLVSFSPDWASRPDLLAGAFPQLVRLELVGKLLEKAEELAFDGDGQFQARRRTQRLDSIRRAKRKRQELERDDAAPGSGGAEIPTPRYNSNIAWLDSLPTETLAAGSPAKRARRPQAGAVDASAVRASDGGYACTVCGYWSKWRHNVKRHVERKCAGAALSSAPAPAANASTKRNRQKVKKRAKAKGKSAKEHKNKTKKNKKNKSKAAKHKPVRPHSSGSLASVSLSSSMFVSSSSSSSLRSRSRSPVASPSSSSSSSPPSSSSLVLSSSQPSSYSYSDAPARLALAPLSYMAQPSLVLVPLAGTPIGAVSSAQPQASPGLPSLPVVPVRQVGGV